MDMILCPHCERASTAQEIQSGMCLGCAASLYLDPAPATEVRPKPAEPRFVRQTNGPWIVLVLVFLIGALSGAWISLAWVSQHRGEPTPPAPTAPQQVGPRPIHSRL